MYGNDPNLKGFKKLFDKIYPQLCVFAYKYVQDLDMSKDIVQEVFLDVWENQVIFQDENYMTNYFYKRVKKDCIAYLKSHPNKVSEDCDASKQEELKKEEDYISKAIVIEIIPTINEDHQEKLNKIFKNNRKI